MTNPLPFAESLLCWCLANYAFCSNVTRPVHDPDTGLGISRDPSSAGAARKLAVPGRWYAWVAARSLLCAILLAGLGLVSRMSLLLAAAVLTGSLTLTLVRARWIPVRFLAEAELAASALATFAAWRIAGSFPPQPALLWIPELHPSQLAAVCVCAAVLLYMIRGGDLFVRGILEKAGGLPSLDEPADSDKTYTHGKVIGQVERIIVVLLVMAGNLQALAFFFAAKGLIRSKELEKRPVADYFLLGSLSSFLLGLGGGLILQQTLALLWR
jgi:hypothetical protein